MPTLVLCRILLFPLITPPRPDSHQFSQSDSPRLRTTNAHMRPTIKAVKTTVAPVSMARSTRC